MDDPVLIASASRARGLPARLSSCGFRWLLAATLSGAAAIALALPAPSQAGALYWYGYNADFAAPPLGGPDAATPSWPAKSTLSGRALIAREREEARIDTMLQHAVSGGSKMIRVNLLWSFVENTRGYRDWSYYDYFFSRVQRFGLRPIIVLVASPRWATETYNHMSLFDTPGPNGRINAAVRPSGAAMPAFSLFSQAAAARYSVNWANPSDPNVKVSAAAFEVWNEPNLPEYWNPVSMSASTHEYALLTWYAAVGVKTGNPYAAVIAGGVSPGRDGWRSWLSNYYGQYDGQVKDWFDGLAAHPYAHRKLDGTSVVESIMKQYDGVLGAKVVAGDASPIWVTEVGITTNPWWPWDDKGTEVQQGNWLATVEDRLRDRGAAAMIVHTLYDAPPSASWDSGSGVMRAPGSTAPAQPKYAYCMMARRHSSPVC